MIEAEKDRVALQAALADVPLLVDIIKKLALDAATKGERNLKYPCSRRYEFMKALEEGLKAEGFDARYYHYTERHGGLEWYDEDVSGVSVSW